ncbi:MAG: hypothetical protein GYB31_05285 [Bacteroidetes bacterium]|nr:hypothetical protein [Bacteroidota bacterium]
MTELKKPVFRGLFKWVLLNFLLAAGIGALLRFVFVAEIPGLEFKHFLHAHSHVAMLGWLYLGLFLLLVQAFVKANFKKYKILFWATQFSILGMLLTFPIQGYAGLSIAFSTAHILCSYLFVWFFVNDTGRAFRRSTSGMFVITALVLMVVSTIALWGMAPVMILELQHKPLYYMLVQAFLHFQFNGWFTFAAIGLLFWYFESIGIAFERKQVKSFFFLLLVSCILTYFLAVTWANPRDFLFALNSLGAALQFLALVLFVRLIFNQRKPIQSKLQGVPRLPSVLFKIAIFSFVMKILIQTVVIIPAIAQVTYTVRNFVIGFIHLILLGFVTAFVLFLAYSKKNLDLQSVWTRAGGWLYIGGFILSELLLFGQGAALWAGWGFMPAYYLILFGVSALIPIGILLLLIGQIKAESTSR